MSEIEWVTAVSAECFSSRLSLPLLETPVIFPSSLFFAGGQRFAGRVVRDT